MLRPSLHELLKELRKGRNLHTCPILVDIENHEYKTDHGAMTMVTRTSIQSDWSSTFAREYGDCPYINLESKRSRSMTVTLNVGRSRTSDILLKNPSISKHHATIRMDRLSGDVTVTDQQSRNGTLLDGTRISSGATGHLWAGVRVAFGTAAFVFLDPPTLNKLSKLV